MRTLLLLAALSAFFPFSLVAQDSPVMKYGKISDADLSMKSYAPDTSAAAVVLFDYGHLTFDFKNDDVHYSLERHKRIKIMKKAGFDHGNIAIPFASGSTKVRQIKAQVIAPDGKETELANRDIFTEKINGDFSRIRFAFPNMQEGCVIEYKYTLESSNIFLLPEWYFQANIPVRWSELYMEVPAFYNYVALKQGRKLDVEEARQAEREVAVSGTTGSQQRGTTNMRLVRYAIKDAPAMSEEPFITTLDDYLSKIRFQLTSIDVRPVLDNWERLAAELMDLDAFGKQITKNKATDDAWAAAQPLLQQTANPAEKIDVLGRFVSENIRIDETPGIFASKSLSDVYEKKSGTIAEMNLLLVALLRRAGYTAHPALISTRDHGQPMPSYPMVDQFNHVMAMVEHEGVTRLLDAGSAYRPSVLPAVNSLNKHAWVVNPINARWIDITPTAASQTEVVKVQLSETGDANAYIELQSDNYFAQAHREGMAGDKGEAYWKELMHEFFADAVLDSVRYTEQNNIYKPLGTHLHFSVPAQAQVNDDFLYATPVVLSQFQENPFKLEKRVYAVDIPFPIKERMVIEITPPPGYQLEALPEAVKLVLPNNGGRFQYTATQKDTGLLINCSVNVTQLHYEPVEYDALRSFFTMVSGKLGEQIVFKKKS